MIKRPPEFSFRTRAQALRRMATEEFDLIVIGGGITGAGVAHDAAHRGLKVALIERADFAQGTSSRSSKLIHGGLRYLENYEFHLVFEALSERAHLLRTAPHLVKPLPFFMPVYEGDRRGKWLLSAGLWLYDLLALGRAPQFHEYFGRDRLLAQMPGLKSQGLLGGFKYYDATMWDDVMTVEVARAAHAAGAAVANHLAVTAAHWEGDQVRGVWVEERTSQLHASEGDSTLLEGVDLHSLCPKGCEKILIRGKRVISCVGPWTDEWGKILVTSPGAPSGAHWAPWLTPSKGVHLVFSLKRIPAPGCFVMSEDKDGRIAFVIPRPDMGPGVTIVGTTDGPAPADPAQVRVEQKDVDYLLGLLDRYFPDLGIQASDILSSYAGVRPLFGGAAASATRTLRKVSREHHIAWGPGGTVFVAGGKYTTYRRMAQEITLFALDRNKGDRAEFSVPRSKARRAGMPDCFNPLADSRELAIAQARAREGHLAVPQELWARYGAAALAVMQGEGGESRPGFPRLGAQRRFAVEHEMAFVEEDFRRRRSALWAVDHHGG